MLTSEVSESKRSRALSSRLRGLMSVTMVVALSLYIGRLSSWSAGVLTGVLLLLLWRVRGRRYALVPGAAIGVLISWVCSRW